MRVWERHPSSPSHYGAEQYQRHQAAKTIHDVTITENFVDFGIVEHDIAITGTQRVLVIENRNPSTAMSIINVGLSFNLDSHNPSRFESNISNFLLVHNEPVNLTINFRANNAGLYVDKVEITFRDPQLDQQFVIARAIKASVGSNADHELLRARAPYVPRRRRAREEEQVIIPGEAPPSPGTIRWVIRLAEAKIPESLHSIFSEESGGEVVPRMQERSFLPVTFESSTYVSHFKRLL